MFCFAADDDDDNEKGMLMMVSRSELLVPINQMGNETTVGGLFLDKARSMLTILANRGRLTVLRWLLVVTNISQNGTNGFTQKIAHKTTEIK